MRNISLIREVIYMNTQGFNLGFKIGIYIALLLGVIFFIRTQKKKKGKKVYYDERQEKIRGDAYRYGFKAMLMWIIASLFLEILFERALFDRPTFAVLTMVIGIGVNLFYSILNGSYFYIGMKRKGYIIMLIILSIINLLASISMFLSGQVVVNGVVTYKSINMIVALLLIFILLVIYIRDKAEKILEKRNEE